MLFSYGSGRQQIDDNEKCRQITGNFDCHADAAVRCRVHRPIEHIHGFTQSHWVPGKWNTMVMMFVGGVVLMLDGFLELLGVKLFNTDA
jgi:hypothetical protein